MPKELTWVLLIAGGIFLGNLLYEQYAIYRAQKIIEVLVDDIQGSMSEVANKQLQRSAELQRANEKKRQMAEAQKAAKIEAERKAEFDKTTACGINEDKGTCSCLNMKTSAKIQLSFEECSGRARNITW